METIMGANHNKSNAIVYKCSFCELEQEFTVLLFIEHLDKFHADISRKKQIEAINNLSHEISKFIKQQKIKIRLQKPAKKSKSYIREKIRKDFAKIKKKKKPEKKPYAKIIYTPMGNKR